MSVKATTCRMFETPLIERFSRIHPLTPFVFWVPVLAAQAIYAGVHGVGVVTGALLAVLGLLVWTLLEYGLHRYLFHYIGPRLWQRRLHFVAHGVHHDFPQDRDRLVMPLGVSVPIGALVYWIFHLLGGPMFALPTFVGFGVGYLAYDGTHYAIHHLRMSSRWGKWIKRHHMVHHHTGSSARWGVSSPLWDYVFGTMGTEAAPRADRQKLAS
ncbi:MAG TPA: sterol desaturase family protein [Byssovorax sp.]|jgi:sterol desaturase/sphingolipid hydroxylase (fatty acid hydroxylase superfamily)